MAFFWPRRLLVAMAKLLAASALLHVPLVTRARLPCWAWREREEQRSRKDPSEGYAGVTEARALCLRRCAFPY